MDFSKEDIRHLGDLSKMKLSDEEIEHFQKEFTSIVGFIQTLDELDVSNVEPLYQLSGAQSRTGVDVVEQSVVAEDIRSQFPESTDDQHLIVRSVFSKSE
ncbi:MAG: Asp-tRNA(Asn)/Glu-tRNA(Gln) amidotransferase subunit GatC [Candidatus Kerfeldbacteria bacterium]|nr:Asp-tRNA(Asn)/Glu-tRNA(Gln) amidotransferase subunit GatC [Candidatus Kerfeldbacteria bacterium]